MARAPNRAAREGPWEKALEVILRQYGLGYVLEGNILRAGEPQKIVPPSRRER